MVLFGVSIDFVAVAAAAAAAFVFGVVWFAPPLLGKYWIEEGKLGNSAKAGMGRTLGSSVVSCLLTAFVLEVLLMALRLPTWASAAELAALVWLGFYFAKEFAAVMSGDRTAKVFASIMIHDAMAVLITVAVLFALH
jgi:hypothetical protein